MLFDLFAVENTFVAYGHDAVSAINDLVEDRDRSIIKVRTCFRRDAPRFDHERKVFTSDAKAVIWAQEFFFSCRSALKSGNHCGLIYGLRVMLRVTRDNFYDGYEVCFRK